jgi:hypothetical protein
MNHKTLHIDINPALKTNGFERRILLLVVLFAMLQLSISLLSNGFTFSFDESIWQYIGRNWFRHGLTPYEGGVDNKSPFIFAVYGLSDLIFGENYWFPQVLGTICQSIGLYFVYKIAVDAAGKHAGYLAVLFYGLSLMWRSADGKYVSCTETYEITVLIIGFYRYQTSKTSKDLFICGVLVSLAGGLRMSAFFGFVALCLDSIFNRKKSLWPLAAGAASGVILFGAAIVLAGIKLPEFFFYAFSDNFGTGSVTDHSILWRLENLFDKFFYSEFLLFYPLVIGYFLTIKKMDLFGLWLIFAFTAINAIGIYDRSHLKEILPAICLMSAISLDALIRRYQLPLKRVTVIIWIVFFPKLLEPFVGLKKLVMGTKTDPTKSCLPPYPKPDDAALKKLGFWIKANTTSDQKVLVAGFGALVQVYSNRMSPSIFFNVTQTTWAKQRFYRDLNQDKPGMILVPMYDDYRQNVDSNVRQFINQIVANEYAFTECLYGYSIYQHKPTWRN